MAQLWSKGSGTWEPRHLVKSAYALGLPVSGTGTDDSGLEAVVVRGGGEAPLVWALLTRSNSSVRVNGLPVPGIRVLAHRDQIHFPDHTVYFSTEECAEIVLFSAGGRAINCPRCKLPIEVRTLAVRCPRCAVWHHESGEYPCWTYAATCSGCDHPADLEAGFQWTPDDD